MYFCILQLHKTVIAKLKTTHLSKTKNFYSWSNLLMLAQNTTRYNHEVKKATLIIKVAFCFIFPQKHESGDYAEPLFLYRRFFS